MPMTKPVVWTIAGTDPSGGAGIQGDLKTMNALGVHGCSVITALIAQNTTGVCRCDFVNRDLLSAQIDNLFDDIPPVAIKIGVLGTSAAAEIVAAFLRRARVFTVFDPVMGASSGHPLIQSKAVTTIKREVLPLISLLTPNLPEAEMLLGRKIHSPQEMECAARDILKFGCQAVLLKGGHIGAGYSQDYWTDGQTSWWFTSPRINARSTHGTGCALSSAIAAITALGYTQLDALTVAKAYINQAISGGGDIGKGKSPVAHDGWPHDPSDMPWISGTAAEGVNRTQFPPCDITPFGFYPIIDRSHWIKVLAPHGVKHIQLRIKDLHGNELNDEIRLGIEEAASYGVRLFINDAWQAALAHHAYGVHLGQTDLIGADLNALQAAGIRLGISANGYFEVGRALAYRPSYIGIGSIYPTSSKIIEYKPLGVRRFCRLRCLIATPVVGIGGITLERAWDLWNAGADGMAVISDLQAAKNMAERVKAWLDFFAEAAERKPQPGRLRAQENGQNDA